MGKKEGPDVCRPLATDLYKVLLAQKRRWDHPDDAELIHPRLHQLDDPDWDPVVYVNNYFPDEASLTDVPEALDAVDSELAQLSDRIVELLNEQRGQQSQAMDCVAHLDRALSLFETTAADLSTSCRHADENMIGIAEGIEALHKAKTNIGLVATSLQRFLMLDEAFGKLRRATDEKDFGTCAALVRAVEDLLGCEQLAILPHHGVLRSRADALFDDIRGIIREELDLVFEDRPSCGRSGTDEISDPLYASICSCAEAMDGLVDELRCKLARELITSYEDHFQPGAPDAGLVHVKRRFAWLKQVLNELRSNLVGKKVPRSWAMEEIVAQVFIAATSRHLRKELDASSFDMEPDTLELVIKHVRDSERSLILATTEGLRLPAGLEKADGPLVTVFTPFLGPWFGRIEATLNRGVRVCLENVSAADKEPERESPRSADPKEAFASAADFFALAFAQWNRAVDCQSGKPLQKVAVMIDVSIRKYLAGIDDVTRRLFDLAKGKGDEAEAAQLKALAVMIGTLEYAERITADFDAEFVKISGMPDEQNDEQKVYEGSLNDIWELRSQYLCHVADIASEKSVTALRRTLTGGLADMIASQKREAEFSTPAVPSSVETRPMWRERMAEWQRALSSDIIFFSRYFRKPVVASVYSNVISKLCRTLESEARVISEMDMGKTRSLSMFTAAVDALEVVSGGLFAGKSPRLREMVSEDLTAARQHLVTKFS